MGDAVAALNTWSACRELEVAQEFFALAKTVPTPFMRSYYQRVGERYLFSKGELRVETPSRSSLEHTHPDRPTLPAHEIASAC